MTILRETASAGKRRISTFEAAPPGAHQLCSSLLHNWTGLQDMFKQGTQFCLNLWQNYEAARNATSIYRPIVLTTFAPISFRYCIPSNCIFPTASYAFARAASSVSPIAVTPSTRPPLVTSRPSTIAVPP